MERRCALTLTALAMLSLAAPTYADRRSDALIRDAQQSLGRVKSYQADLVMRTTVKGKTQESRGTLKLMRPNYARVELEEDGRKSTYASDGRKLYVVFGPMKEYMQSDASPDGHNVPDFIGFFDLKSFIRAGDGRYGGVRTIDGERYETIVTTTQDELKVDPPVTRTYYFGQDRMLARIEEEIAGPNAIALVTLVKNAKIDAPMKANEFAFAPPAGYARYDEGMLAVGKDAPDFNLPRADGGRIALSDALKGKKAVLVNFWFYG